MKALLSILFVATLYVNSYGQGIFHYYTGLILPDKDAPLRTDRLGLDLYYGSWLDMPEGIKYSPFSVGVNVFRIYDIPFGHSPFGIGIGYGLSSHNIHHNGSFVHFTDSISGKKMVDLVPNPDNYKPRKNKLSINYFEIPFELRFRTKRKLNKNGEMKGPFRFYPGFKVGYLVNIHTSRKDNTGKYKEYNFANIEKIRYGATLRVGFGKMSIFGFYALNTLFKEDNPVGLQSFSVGVSFLTF